jgi:protein O-GlcNAc transferase
MKRNVEIATQLAGDPARMQQLRGDLRSAMSASPLMDAKGFTRNVEVAYRDMWRRFCRP